MPADPKCPSVCDAVLLPPGYVPALDVDDETIKTMGRLAAEFVRVLRPAPGDISARSVDPEGLVLINRDTTITYKFHSNHSRHPELRHEWFDRGDGVMYGLLKRDPPLPASTAEETEETEAP